MKNQNDMIFSIVAIVVAVIAAAAFFIWRPIPIQPAKPPVADVSTPVLPQAQVVMGNGLPGSTAPAAGAASGLGGPNFGPSGGGGSGRFTGPGGPGGPGGPRGGPGGPGKGTPALTPNTGK